MRPLFPIAFLLVTTAASAQIAGRVVDANGTPIRGARVYVWMAMPLHGTSSICPSCYRECGKHVDTAADGEFRVDGLDPNLKVRLLAAADDFEPSFVPFHDPSGRITATLRRRAPEEEQHLIRGRVIDPNGKPLLGAEVAPSGVYVDRGVGYGAIPGLELLSITNAKGEFALRIPPNAHKLDVRVRASGYGPAIERGLVPGVPRTIGVSLGAAVVGRIVHDGRAVGGVAVKFVQLDTNSRSFLGTDEIGTDENGRFTMTGLGTDEVYVVAVAMDAAPLTAAKKIVFTGGDLATADLGTFELTTGCRIAGRAAPHTRVTLFHDNTFDACVTESGDDGSFAFDGVPPDRLTLRAGRARRGVTVTGDHDVTDLVLSAQ